MIELLLAAAAVQRVCDERGFASCVIGGLALQRWGEIRATTDADLTVLSGFGGEEPVIDALLAEFAPRRPDARSFAIRARVLLLRADPDVAVDVALGALPFEERAVERATPYRYDDDVELRTCSAEDLVVMKAFAGRDRDWSDLAGIATRQGERLDRALIREELAPLLALKEAPEDLERLEALLDRYAGEPS